MITRLSKCYPVIFITLIVFLMSSFIFVANYLTASKIQVYRDAQTLELLKRISPEVDAYVYNEERGLYSLYDSATKLVGYGFQTKGMGFNRWIYILVGLLDKETIMNVIVTAHEETFGNDEEHEALGPISFDKFTQQFSGLKITDSDLNFNGGKIDGITGGTGSSLAICQIVKEASLEKVKYIE